MRFFKLIVSTVLTVLLFSIKCFPQVSGNLSIAITSSALFEGVVPGDTVTYSIIYSWTGNGQADNVQIQDVFPSEVSILSSEPQYSSQNDNNYYWDIGTMQNGGFGYITITGMVANNVQLGTIILNKVMITGDASDTDTSDNHAESKIEVQTPAPDLWVYQFGLLESLSQGILFTAEKDIPADFEVYYINFSKIGAENVVLTDTLPAGLSFVSSVPSPISTSDNIITWDLGTVAGYSVDKIQMKLKPTQIGNINNTVSINASNGDRTPENNFSVFPFQVVSVLPPILLKPSAELGNYDSPLITASNPSFEGLAKAGATVSLYEGDSVGCLGDLSSCNMTKITEVTAGSDRHWTMTTSNLTGNDKHYLYFQAEFDGDKSSPPFGFWIPLVLQVEPILDSADYDMSGFVVQSGDQNVTPGALGGTSGTTPDQDIVLKARFKAPNEILTDKNLWKNHELKVIITENGTTEKMLPLDTVVQYGTSSGTGFNQFDFTYVQKGLSPGSKVEFWYKPVYYDDNKVPHFGLIYVKLHEVLIDPAGYVYDVDLAGGDYEWPSIPPKRSLIKNATVTALVRAGDTTWTRWKAEETGQVNPQVSDSTTEDKIKVPGYFAFYVPSGQYQLKAEAIDYADYVSPILTVIDEPVFHNIGMTRVVSTPTEVKDQKFDKTVPKIFTLEQNYPNPFNPVTTIEYYIPESQNISLKIYNTLGQEVAIIIQNEYQQKGRHVLQYDASGLSSGVYFYRLTSGKQSQTKKFVILK